MILIVTNKNDSCSSRIIDWLRIANKSYVRLNTDNYINIITISIDFFIIRIEGETINSEDICSTWFRKGKIGIVPKSNLFENSIEYEFAKYTRENESKELNFLSEFIYTILENKPKIGSSVQIRNNKIRILRQAGLLGIKIPKTFILTNKANLIEIFGHNSIIVTKTTSESFIYIKGSDVVVSYTEFVEEIDNLPNEFAPSLVQEYIEREYEIRSFFFKDIIFSMAIFESKDSKVIDIREHKFPKNRNIPYKLPKYFEDKLLSLINTLSLDTGSIDIIKSTDGNFYFLEINPVGIFDNVSFNCNYCLEKFVANYLAKL